MLNLTYIKRVLNDQLMSTIRTFTKQQVNKKLLSFPLTKTMNTSFVGQMTTPVKNWKFKRRVQNHNNEVS